MEALEQLQVVNMEVSVSRPVVYPYILGGICASIFINQLVKADSMLNSLLFILAFLLIWSVLFLFISKKCKKKLLWIESDYVHFDKSKHIEKIELIEIENIHLHALDDGKYEIRVESKSQEIINLELPNYLSFSELKLLERKVNQLLIINR